MNSLNASLLLFINFSTSFFHNPLPCSEHILPRILFSLPFIFNIISPRLTLLGSLFSPFQIHTLLPYCEPFHATPASLFASLHSPTLLPKTNIIPLVLLSLNFSFLIRSASFLIPHSRIPSFIQGITNLNLNSTT